MAANTSPIYSLLADIQGGDILTTASADYTGQGINNAVVFTSNATNGGFVQRLRFKALGTNVASVARIYINNSQGRLAAAISAVSGTPTGTPSTSGGTLQAGSFFAKIVAIDQFGGVTAASTESASVAVTGTTGSIGWSWTAVTGAVSYRIYVGPVTGGQNTYFTSATNAFTQTTAIGTRDNLTTGINNNNYFYGELSLPATTASATAATVDIDYPMNFALPPGYRIIVGLGTTVAAGWQCLAIGGQY
jgi:hypothetical protein